MCCKRAGTIRSSLLPPLFLTLGVPRRGSIMPKNWKDRFGKTSKSSFPRRAACMVSIQVCSWMRLELRWLWEAMEAGGKTVSFDLGRPGDGSYQTDQIAAIAKRHPGLKIVLCHMGQPSRTCRARPGALVRMAGADPVGYAAKRLVRSFCAPVSCAGGRGISVSQYETIF